MPQLVALALSQQCGQGTHSENICPCIPQMTSEPKLVAFAICGEAGVPSSQLLVFLELQTTESRLRSRNPSRVRDRSCESTHTVIRVEFEVHFLRTLSDVRFLCVVKFWLGHACTTKMMKTLISARLELSRVKNGTRHGDLAIRDRFRRCVCLFDQSAINSCAPVWLRKAEELGC